MDGTETAGVTRFQACNKSKASAHGPRPNNPVWPVAKRGPEGSAGGRRPRLVAVWEGLRRPRFEPNDVRFGDEQLGCFLDQRDPLAVGNEAGQRREQMDLPDPVRQKSGCSDGGRSCPPGGSEGAGQRPGVHQVERGKRRPAANRERRPIDRTRRDHSRHARAVHERASRTSWRPTPPCRTIGRCV